jgi:hypothetical protein
MRTLTDPADDLLARSDDLEIHTQHTMQLDSAPDFHGSSEDEEALFSGLSGKAPKRVKMPKAAGVKQMKPGASRAPATRAGGFMPGMGDLDGNGFMPGMGDLSGPAARVVARRPAPPRPANGFMPGMGEFSVAGMGLGTLAIVGVAAWMVFGRKRA